MTFTQHDGTERWDRNAEQWHRNYGENDPSRRHLLDPIIMEVLGDVSGKRILDAGCGDGYLSRKLARLGAVLTGVEFSPAMLAYALEEHSRDNFPVTYYHGDITSMPFLTGGSFDVVVTNNVIQDVADYQAVFREFNRVLKAGGIYLHIENHPCYITPVFGWVRDGSGNKLYRKVDRYFERGPFLTPWGPKSGMEPSVYWHRTLGDIMNYLISTGFRIMRVIEPEPTESAREACPSLVDNNRVPDFLVLVCRRE